MVELLIVVVILGILAAVAIPRFVTTKAESQTQACRSNLAAIQSKIEEYLFTSSATPASTAGTIVSAADAGLAVAGITSTSFPNGIPKCPAGTTAATTDYVVSATGKVTCPNVATMTDHHL